MAWTKSGSTTLNSAGDTITVSGMTVSKFNEVLIHAVNNLGIDGNLTINNNSNQIYARSRSADGANPDAVAVDQTSVSLDLSWDTDLNCSFTKMDILNVNGEEKLGIVHSVLQGAVGAGNAPNRIEIVFKAVPSSLTTDITRFDVNNTRDGSYDVGSNISALGSDGVATPAPNNVQDNSIFVEKNTGERYWSSLGTQPDTITKDTQAIIQSGSTGTGAPDTFSSFTVANNSNRILILACGTYNADPDITSVTWNSTETFTKIASEEVSVAYRVELWYLINPTATTASCVIGSTGMGQMGACLYSFYNIDQSSPIGTPVTKSETTNTTTPFINITPVNSGSMIIDSWYNGHGTTVTNNETDGMAIICGGVDRNMASQYNLTPTIGSANSMSRTSGSDKYTQVAVEVNANLVNPKVVDGSIFYETDTNKSYVLSSNTWTEL